MRPGAIPRNRRRGCRSGVVGHSMRPAILTRLWAKMPCPHQVRAPWSPSMRVRLSPKSRLAQLIRPSQPVRHRTIFLNARRCSTSRRAAVGLPLRGSTTWRTPRGSHGVFDRLFAVAAIGGHRAGSATGAMFDALDRGFEHGRVGRVAGLDVVIDDHAVFVVDDLGFVTELDGLAEPAFGDRPRIGVMQRHDAGRTVGGGACEPLAASVRRPSRSRSASCSSRSTSARARPGASWPVGA